MQPPRATAAAASLRTVSTDYELYVEDPAEPPARRRFARLAPALWALIVVILLVGTTAVYWAGRGLEDPSLTVPASEGADS